VSKLQIYRAITPNKKTSQYKLEHRYYDTMRPPGNVPYLVDNLWEWLRPNTMPCRRFAAYASPRSEDALKAIKNKPDGKAFPVEFLGEYKLAQVNGIDDSKEHPECTSLKKDILNLLKDVAKSGDKAWIDWDLEEKLQLGQLWMPCLRKKEINFLFENVPHLRDIRDALKAKIKYWNDVTLLHPEK